MTTLVREPSHAFVNMRHGFGHPTTAEWGHQQISMNDGLNRFGRRVHEVELDFHDDVSTTGLTSVDDGGTGTNAFQDAAGGWYNVVTAAADNDYHAMSSDNEAFLFALNKPLWFEIIFKVAEGTTGKDAAFWFGLTDTLTTGGFQANAAGPLASYDGALWWKDEGGTTFSFETSNATTQDTESAIFTFEDDTTTRLGFYFDGAATTGGVIPYYSVGGDIWNLKQGPITTVTLSGLAEMHFVFGVKSGPGGSAETLQVDYLRCAQVR